MDVKHTLEQAVAALTDIDDTLTRCRETHNLAALLDDTARTLTQMRRADLVTLHDQGMTDTALGAALGVSDRRISQIRASKAGPGPERALFAPRAGQRAHILVTEKHETERNRPAVMLSTHNMLVALQTHLAAYQVESVSEAVPGGGDVDLNRDNLIVMMGPRSRPLIRQALSADPAIEWRLDNHDQGYLHDRRSGKEYHSDFDNIRPRSTEPPGVCYAHIGRISSPNQRGSFLIVGGLHGPGTAGAVSYLMENAADVYAEVRRNLWSAIVKVHTDHTGAHHSAELVTPLYRHGKTA